MMTIRHLESTVGPTLSPVSHFLVLRFLITFKMPLYMNINYLYMNINFFSYTPTFSFGFHIVK